MMNDYEKELALFKLFNNKKRRECYHINSFLDKSEDNMKKNKENEIQIAKKIGGRK